jgi:phage replication O-like protein O
MGPQLENGYTKIADAILENMSKAKLNGTQFRILLIVWRSTYGWGKKSFALSESYLSEATGIHKQQIKRELKAMIDLGVLIETKAPTFNTSREIQFNKHYLNSTEVAKKIPVNKLDTSTGSELDTPTGSELDTQNRHINKQINKQTEINDFFQSCWSMYPRKEGKGSVSDKTKKERFKLGDEFIRCIERYKEKLNHNKTESKFIMKGSTFWNSGYVDYLDSSQEEKPKLIIDTSTLGERVTMWND